MKMRDLYLGSFDKDGTVDWAELAFADEANYKGN